MDMKLLGTFWFQSLEISTIQLKLLFLLFILFFILFF